MFDVPYDPEMIEALKTAEKAKSKTARWSLFVGYPKRHATTVRVRIYRGDIYQGYALVYFPTYMVDEDFVDNACRDSYTFITAKN